MKHKTWEVGQEITVKAQPFNHEDDREITLRYVGDGILEDVSNGHKVKFDGMMFPKVAEDMNIVFSLVHNPLVCESYKVVRC